MSDHTQSEHCFQGRIRTIAEDCDNEFYLGSISANSERCERAAQRIRAALIELEQLAAEADCAVCRTLIATQLELQAEGADGIERGKPLIDQGAL